MTQSDVIIVGAGGAGIAAAIEAASRGLAVSIVDAAQEAGGTAQTSGGGTFLAGTPFQRQQGIEDSAGDALQDWLTWGGDSVDVEWARRYVEDSGTSFYKWLANLGVTWTFVQHQEGNRKPRWHAPKNGGLGTMQTLIQAARQFPNVKWLFERRLAGLISEGGRITGIQVETPTGPQELTAKAVVLATGGFNNSMDMVRRYGSQLPESSRVLLGGGTGARGQAHAVLDSLGAQFVNMDSIWFYPYATPDYRDPSGERGLVVRGLTGDIWVNSSARRFHNEELRGGNSGAPALLRQDPPTCWSIFDATIAASYFISAPHYRLGSTTFRNNLDRLLRESPYLSSGETLEDLGSKAGLEPKTLANTVDDHNRRITLAESKDEFGRTVKGLRPLADPPFFAMQFFPLARKNLGGVRTNHQCQVLNTAGDVIPGLWAAGELAGMAGGSINGRAALEGTMIGPSIYSGRIAGQHAGG